jgi:hypothetical protein
VGDKLPHLHQLLRELCVPCCGKEVEALCATLAALLPALARPHASAVAAWAVADSENALAQVRPASLARDTACAAWLRPPLGSVHMLGSMPALVCPGSGVA